MKTTQARFETGNGAKYLQQLCKHFAHKVSVQFDERTGRADLPAGSAEMQADATGLTLRATAADDAGLDRTQHILEDHLRRFAFREDPQPLIWADA